MNLSTKRFFARPLGAALVIFAAIGTGCARMGDLAEGQGTTLAKDAKRLRPDDPAAPGPHLVLARGTVVEESAGDLPIVVYRPAKLDGPAPSVVFLPGRVAPESQYESYARALASRGFVVAVRGWYSMFLTDEELTADARRIADWLVAHGLAIPGRIGVAGHSMGAKDAIAAALEDRRFAAVVALDPDDNGRHTIAKGPISKLAVPLLLVGAEVAWKASSICAPKESNYERFFERSPIGTIELTLRDADHVQVMDDATGFGYGICRAGGADPFVVRTLARGATVAFFSQHLLGGAKFPDAWGAGAFMRVREAADLVGKRPDQASEMLKARRTPNTSATPSLAPSNKT